MVGVPLGGRRRDPSCGTAACPHAAMDVQSLDPHDDAAVAAWAAQLGVPVATLREAIAAIGTDIDKIQDWLAARAARAARPSAH